MIQRATFSLLRNYEAEIKRLKQKLIDRDRDLEEATKTATDLIKRFTRIQFYQRGAENFEVCVQFNALFLGGAQRNEMQFMAEYVGRLVEAEIATCRFMQSVYDNHRREISDRCGILRGR